MKRTSLLAGLTLLGGLALGQSSTRNVLLESITVSTSGWAPDAHVIIDELSSTIPNGQFIPLNIHWNDPMLNNSGQAVVNFFNAFTNPTGAIDRSHYSGEGGIFQGRGFWDVRIADKVNQGAPCTVSIDKYYDETSRTVHMSISANFSDAVSGDIRFHAYALEDSVVGAAGTNFDQANNFAQSSGGTDPSHPYYNSPDPIPSYVHRHVMRHSLLGAEGLAGIIPANVLPGETYQTDLSYEVHPNRDANQMSFVAFVSYYDAAGFLGNEILNATSCHLMDAEVACEPVFSYSQEEQTVSFNNISSGNWTTVAWDFGDGNTSNQTNPTHTYANPGDYEVCMSLFDNTNLLCGQKCDSTFVFTTGVADFQPLEPQLTISPNPINTLGMITFQLEKPAQVTVNLRDGLGRIVRELRSGRMVAGTQSAAIYSGDLANGMYWVELNIDGYRVQEKVILTAQP